MIMRFSIPVFTLSLLFVSNTLFAAQELSQPLPISNIAQPEQPPQQIQNTPTENGNWQQVDFSTNIQNQLNLALRKRNAAEIAYWLKHYQANTPQQQFLRDYAQGVLAQLNGGLYAGSYLLSPIISSITRSKPDPP